MVCPCGRPQIFFIKEQIYLQAISWANNPACFIAGTLVLAKEGKKAIENIVPGDEVLAYDESTGDMQYKKVARVFRNTTDKWYHLTVDGEEIVCTPLHPFYVVGVGFKHAKDLRLTDLLLTSQGNCAKIQSIVVEKLSTPEVTYNFEVEDFHTYYVGNGICVHNECVSGDTKYFSEHESRNSAFRAAKRDAGIPMCEQPTKVIQSVDKFGRPLTGRTYIFGKGQNAVQIMEHAAGHAKGGIGPHFNILGSKWHYLFP